MQETLYDIIIDDCLLILKVTDRILNMPKDLQLKHIEELKNEVKIIENINVKMEEILDKASFQLSAQTKQSVSTPAQTTLK
jgi:hypothetical protein